MVSRNIVLDLDDDFLFNRAPHWGVFGKRANVRTADNFNVFGMFLLRRIDHGVIDEEVRRLCGNLEVGISRICDDALYRTVGSRLRRDEADMSV